MLIRRCLLVVCSLFLTSPMTRAEPITYQGVLNESGQPANGLYDMRFTLFDTASGGTSGNIFGVASVQVSDGLFSAEFNLPSGVLLGDAPKWIEVSVRPAGAGSYSALSPRQPLNWSPRSLHTRGFSVESDGDVGLGIDDPGARFHIAGGGNEANLLQVNQTLFANDAGFVGINRSTPVTGAEYFGVRSRTTGTDYGGMYVDTLSPIGKPFYGYSTFGAVRAFSYFDSESDELRVNVAGDRVRIHATNGTIGISNAPLDYARLFVSDQSDPSISFSVYASGGQAAAVYGTNFNAGGAGGYFIGNGNSIGLKARNSGSGDIIVGTSGLVGENTRFRVTNTGDVRADGAFIGGGADFAEMLSASDAASIEPGDVLSIAPDGSLKRCDGAFQTCVAGVCSTKPAFLGGAISDAGEDNDLSGKVPLAVVGIVPTKVCDENGPITPGDLLVASSTPGRAMRAGDNPPAGSVIGKALSPLRESEGIVRVLLMAR